MVCIAASACGVERRYNTSFVPIASTTTAGCERRKAYGSQPGRRGAPRPSENFPRCTPLRTTHRSRPRGLDRGCRRGRSIRARSTSRRGIPRPWAPFPCTTSQPDRSCRSAGGFGAGGCPTRRRRLATSRGERTHDGRRDCAQPHCVCVHRRHDVKTVGSARRAGGKQRRTFSMMRCTRGRHPDRPDIRRRAAIPLGPGREDARTARGRVVGRVREEAAVPESFSSEPETGHR